MGIERVQFATIGLFDAVGDVAAELGQLGGLVALLKQAQRLVDDGILRGIIPGLDQRADLMMNQEQGPTPPPQTAILRSQPRRRNGDAPAACLLLACGWWND
jgi:hypothetical protein